MWHRAFRRAQKQAIHHEREMPHVREVSNPYSMAKDGKVWMPRWEIWDFKKYMRK
jgi:hypothetical protein